MRVKWSQNFLANKNVALSIVRALDLSYETPVLEIGPGKGMLTQFLVGQSDEVVAVEIDPQLADVLEQRFSEDLNFRLIRSDFLEVEQNALGIDGNFKIIGNLPYAVTSPILQKVLTWSGWSSAVFMVQKEVGQRIVAKPGSKLYGVLSISVQAQCRPKKVLDVSSGCFQPAPEVDSVVLRLEPLEEPVFGKAEEESFFKTVRASFAHRRKTLLNSLKLASGIPVEALSAAIASAKLDPGARAETLSIDDFLRLSRMLYNK